MPLENPVLDTAFESLRSELEAFADCHSLRVERYPRGFPMWTFLFQHPRGGAASLQFNLAPAPESGRLAASVLTHWWLDVEPGHRRLAAQFPTAPVATLRPADVRYALERAFDELIGTEESALSHEVWIRRESPLPDLPWPT